ncbi:hypothetical protein AH70_03680 [Pediococcus damnosus LMG 28219]|uniref:hypothetical protein n=1 Tax=Pediococcus damnosus TaxID=51663 RepID=UPI00061E5EC6|nr:hypothetical protein [Pediococcus damnosus]KJU74946.1 hypothetical protein AH70_03680 [Pediococcus damnosus LMG 28219]
MQDTPETAELAKRAEEASQHAKQLRAELRKKRKADKLKLQQQLGAELLKFTDIETVSQLRSYFEKELNQEAQQDIEAQQLAIGAGVSAIVALAGGFTGATALAGYVLKKIITQFIKKGSAGFSYGRKFKIRSWKYTGWSYQ